MVSTDNQPDNGETLNQMIAEAGITKVQAAKIIGVEVMSLRRWCLKRGTSSRKPCPHWAVRLLRFELMDWPEGVPEK